MSVLDHSALEASPLADLHTIASELSIDGYRRLRRADLIAAILDKQGGTESAAAEPDEHPNAEPQRKRAPRARRSPRSEAGEPDAVPVSESVASESVPSEAAPSQTAPRRRAQRSDTEAEAAAAPETGEESEDRDDPEPSTARRRRGRRGGRGRSARDEGETERGDSETEDLAEGGGEELVQGVVELLANGSGFVRVEPPDPSDQDVYISSAQVKRCELVSGDSVAGPKRAPRRSERFASLIRVETINGRPASELADGVHFDDLPAEFPSEPLTLGSEDPTLMAIEAMTPLGKGSRVTIVGASRSGKTEIMRRLANALAHRDELTLQLVLAGVRPEEISDWSRGSLPPAAAVSLVASEDAQISTIEPVIDQARRLAARGADAVVLIDTLDGCGRHHARKALAAARNIVDGGSLTVIATATEPVGGETTVIALDVGLAGVGRFPALDLAASGTVRPELLVGQEGADAIVSARRAAAGGGGV